MKTFFFTCTVPITWLGVVHNTILMSKPHLQEQPQANVYAYNLAFLTDGLYRDGTGQMSGV